MSEPRATVDDVPNCGSENDYRRAASPSSPGTERAAFIKAYPHLDLAEVPDAWGRPMFKHTHVQALWDGWFARATLHDDAQRGNYEGRHPNDMVLHPLTEIREWDEALAELGIQDSDQTPADAIRELNAEIERLRDAAQASGKPAAWRYQHRTGWGDIWRVSDVDPATPGFFETPDIWIVQPLYAAPSSPAAEPDQDFQALPGENGVFALAQLQGALSDIDISAYNAAKWRIGKAAAVLRSILSSSPAADSALVKKALETIEYVLRKDSLTDNERVQCAHIGVRRLIESLSSVSSTQSRTPEASDGK